MSTLAVQKLVQMAAFCVGDEEYVIDIMRVREIIRPQALTPIRRGPPAIDGVLQLRGVSVPVMDMRRRLDLPPNNLASRRIMIVVVGERPVGLIVDRVTEVVRVTAESIQPAPDLLGPSMAPYFLGTCAYRDRILILLNLSTFIAGPAGAIAPPDVDALRESTR